MKFATSLNIFLVIQVPLETLFLLLFQKGNFYNTTRFYLLGNSPVRMPKYLSMHDRIT